MISSTTTASSELVYFTERGSGPPLLLVHGLLITGETFAPVVEHFPGNHRVIVPDLRGHGRSRELSPPYSVAQLATDLSRLLGHLGIDSALCLTTHTAVPLRNNSRSTTTNGAHASYLPARTPSTGQRFGSGSKVTSCRFSSECLVCAFAKLVVSAAADQLGTQLADWLANMMAKQEPLLMVPAWRESMAFDSRRRLADIERPTLVVAGSNDHAVPIHHAMMLHHGHRWCSSRNQRWC